MHCLGQIFHLEDHYLAQSPGVFLTPFLTAQGSLLAPGRAIASLAKCYWLVRVLSWKLVLRAWNGQVASSDMGDWGQEMKPVVYSPKLWYKKATFDQLG
jgi:hypothetical protein